MKAKTVISVFNDRENASNAIEELKDEGYDSKRISILMKDSREGKELADDTGTDVVEGATAGATSGALLGGLAGLVASFIIPGLGAFFIGGPIATALGLTGAAATTASGAATGALAGGILGALTSFGLSDEEAEVYERELQAGGILVAVPTDQQGEDRVDEILSNNGAQKITSVVHDSNESDTISAARPKSHSSQKGRQGWFGDSQGHAMAARGEDVPGRGDGE